MSSLNEKIIALVHNIPRGRVATYQQIAALAGKIQAPRLVVAVLKKNESLPWQRVIAKTGKIAFKPGTHNFKVQVRLLKREGVIVAKDGSINLGKYQWRRKPRRLRGQPHMFRDKL